MPFLKLYQKSIASLVVVSFSVSFFTLPPEALAAPPAPGFPMEIAVAGKDLSPAFVPLGIPPELASIEEVFIPDPKKSQALPLIHIQSVHAHPETQKKIYGLLKFLDEKYGIGSLFIEGAGEELNPNFFRFFDENRLNVRVAEKLVEKGELTGAELFLIESEKKIPAYGIEDPSLYRENLTSFQKVMLERPLTSRFTKETRGLLDRLESILLQPEARKLLRSSESFDAGQMELLSYALELERKAKEILGVDLRHFESQLDWPQMIRFLRLQEAEAQLDPEKIQSERQGLVRSLREVKVDPGLVESFENLAFSPFQSGMVYNPGFRQSDLPRYLAERLVEATMEKRFSFEPYPAFTRYLEASILQSELEPQRLFNEMERLFETLIRTVSKREEEWTLTGLAHKERLFERLFDLELTPKDYAKIQTENETPRPLVRFLLGLESLQEKTPLALPSPHKLVPSNIETIESIYGSAVRFYELAKEREEAMAEKIFEKTPPANPTATHYPSPLTILITGGFHAEGLSRVFRKKGIPYTIVSPRVTEKVSAEAYVSALLGEKKTAFDVQYLEPVISSQSWKMIGSQLPRRAGVRLTTRNNQVKSVVESTIEVGVEKQIAAPILANRISTSSFARDRKFYMKLSEDGEEAILLNENGTPIPNNYGRPIVLPVGTVTVETRVLNPTLKRVDAKEIAQKFRLSTSLAGRRAEVRAKEKGISGGNVGRGVSLPAQRDRRREPLAEPLQRPGSRPPFVSPPSSGDGAVRTTSLGEIVARGKPGRQAESGWHRQRKSPSQALQQTGASNSLTRLFQRRLGDSVQTLALTPLTGPSSLSDSFISVNKKIKYRQSPLRAEVRNQPVNYKGRFLENVSLEDKNGLLSIVSFLKAEGGVSLFKQEATTITEMPLGESPEELLLQKIYGPENITRKDEGFQVRLHEAEMPTPPMHTVFTGNVHRRVGMFEQIIYDVAAGFISTKFSREENARDQDADDSWAESWLPKRDDITVTVYPPQEGNIRIQILFTPEYLEELKSKLSESEMKVLDSELGIARAKVRGKWENGEKLGWFEILLYTFAGGVTLGIAAGAVWRLGTELARIRRGVPPPAIQQKLERPVQPFVTKPVQIELKIDRSSVARERDSSHLRMITVTLKIPPEFSLYTGDRLIIEFPQGASIANPRVTVAWSTGLFTSGIPFDEKTMQSTLEIWSPTGRDETFNNWPLYLEIYEDDQKDGKEIPPFHPTKVYIDRSQTPRAEVRGKDLSRQFSDDKILMKRIERILSPQDQRILLEIRKQLGQLHDNGNIRFAGSIQKYSEFILNRMAFELVFLFPVLPLQSFSLIWGDSVQEVDDSMLGSAVFYNDKPFVYKAAVDSPHIPGSGQPLNEFDAMVSAEAGHFAQGYFRNARGLKSYQGVFSAAFLAFNEAVDHLEDRLYTWIREDSQDPFVSMEREEGAWSGPGHAIGSKWSIRIRENLKRWVAEKKISVENLHLYIRAYARSLTYFDSSVISTPSDQALNRMWVLSSRLHVRFLDGTWLHDEARAFRRIKTVLSDIEAESIESLFRQDQETLLKDAGIDIQPLKEWIATVRNLSPNSPSASENALKALGELKLYIEGVKPILKSKEKATYDYVQQLANQILSIDSPEVLLSEASKILTSRAEVRAGEKAEDRSQGAEVRSREATKRRETLGVGRASSLPPSAFQPPASFGRAEVRATETQKMLERKVKALGLKDLHWGELGGVEIKVKVGKKELVTAEITDVEEGRNAEKILTLYFHRKSQLGPVLQALNEAKHLWDRWEFSSAEGQHFLPKIQVSPKNVDVHDPFQPEEVVKVTFAVRSSSGRAEVRKARQGEEKPGVVKEWTDRILKGLVTHWIVKNLSPYTLPLAYGVWGVGVTLIAEYKIRQQPQAPAAPEKPVAAGLTGKILPIESAGVPVQLEGRIEPLEETVPPPIIKGETRLAASSARSEARMTKEEAEKILEFINKKEGETTDVWTFRMRESPNHQESFQLVYQALLALAETTHRQMVSGAGGIRIMRTNEKSESVDIRSPDAAREIVHAGDLVTANIPIPRRAEVRAPGSEALDLLDGILLPVEFGETLDRVRNMIQKEERSSGNFDEARNELQNLIVSLQSSSKPPLSMTVAHYLDQALHALSAASPRAEVRAYENVWRLFPEKQREIKIAALLNNLSVMAERAGAAAEENASFENTRDLLNAFTGRMKEGPEKIDFSEGNKEAVRLLEDFSDLFQDPNLDSLIVPKTRASLTRQFFNAVRGKPVGRPEGRSETRKELLTSKETVKKLRAETRLVASAGTIEAGRIPQAAVPQPTAPAAEFGLPTPLLLSQLSGLIQNPRAEVRVTMEVVRGVMNVRYTDNKGPEARRTARALIEVIREMTRQAGGEVGMLNQFAQAVRKAFPIFGKLANQPGTVATIVDYLPNRSELRATLTPLFVNKKLSLLILVAPEALKETGARWEFEKRVKELTRLIPDGRAEMIYAPTWEALDGTLVEKAGEFHQRWMPHVSAANFLADYFVVDSPQALSSGQASRLRKRLGEEVRFVSGNIRVDRSEGLYAAHRIVELTYSGKLAQNVLSRIQQQESFSISGSNYGVKDSTYEAYVNAISSLEGYKKLSVSA